LDLIPKNRETSALLKPILRHFLSIGDPARPPDQADPLALPNRRAAGLLTAALLWAMTGWKAKPAGWDQMFSTELDFYPWDAERWLRVVAPSLFPMPGGLPDEPEGARIISGLDPDRLFGLFPILAPEFFRRSVQWGRAGDDDGGADAGDDDGQADAGADAGVDAGWDAGAGLPHLVCLHGKPRGSARGNPKGQAFVVNAISGMVTLAAARVLGKGGEAQAYARALETLADCGLVAGNIIAVDPPGAGPELAARIASLGGVFLFQIKGDPKGREPDRSGLAPLFDDLFKFGLAGRGHGIGVDEHAPPPVKTVGGILSRRIAVARVGDPRVLGWVPGTAGWDSLKTLIRVDGVLDNRAEGKTSTTRRDFASSLELPAGTLLGLTAAMRRDMVGHAAVDDPKGKNLAWWGRRPEDGPSLEFWSFTRKLARNFMLPIFRCHRIYPTYGFRLTRGKNWSPYLKAVLTEPPEKAGRP
jgi:hypothetical protein